MPRRTAVFLFCLLVLFGRIAAAHSAEAAKPLSDAAKFAPETSVFYAELTNPGPIIEIALADKTRKLLENVEGYQNYLRSDPYQQLQAVVGVLQARLGATWQAGIRELLGGGVAVCFDPASNAGFVAVHSRDRNLLIKLNDTLADLIEADAKTHDRPSPVKSKQYQGFTGWSFGGDEVHVIVDDWLLISNKPETLKAAIDRHLDPSAKNLAANEGFAQARAKQPAGAVGWSWLNLAAARQHPKFAEALGKRSNNPLGELLLGGVIDAVKQAPYVAASVAYDGQGLRLRAELPWQASTAGASTAGASPIGQSTTGQSTTGASRTWFFAPRTGEVALAPPNAIGSFTLFRELAGLWLAREELFDEATVAKFAQADTQLGLFFSGRDFGPEVLGELDAPIQLIVARQEYAADKPTPALKLPAFALCFKLKRPDDFAPELLMTYQKVIGIANLVGGQQGKPQFLLSTEERQGAAISKATYLHDSKASQDNAPPHYNFSPACARVGEHFVFGSTVGIVRQLVDALQQGSSKQGSSGAALTANTALTIEAAPLSAILADNKELLITRNMLGQGHTRAEAETVVQTVFDVLALLDRFSIRLTDQPGTLAIETSLQAR